MTVNAQDVADWMKVPGASAVQLDMIAKCLDAVTAYFVAHYDNKPNDNSDDPADWGEDIDLALTMETARLYQRRKSPGGTDAFDDLGVIRVSRFMDPDAMRLLYDYLLPAIG